jgi:hypothetical protein
VPNEWSLKKNTDKESTGYLSNYILPPIGTQEIWAAGVTHLINRDARMEGSKIPVVPTATRSVGRPQPELFLKCFHIVSPVTVTRSISVKTLQGMYLSRNMCYTLICCGSIQACKSTLINIVVLKNKQGKFLS